MINRRNYREESIYARKGKKNNTKIILEPLASEIIKIQRGIVYMTNKRYLTVQEFIDKFFKDSGYINVISTKIGYSLVLPKKEQNDKQN